MATESDRIRSIHQYLPPEVYAWKIADRFHRGICDAYYGGDKADLWVEYKSQEMTKRRRCVPRLSSLQREWLRRQHERGRQVWVILMTDVGHYIMTDPDSWEAGVLPWDACLTKYRLVAEAIKEHCCG